MCARDRMATLLVDAPPPAPHALQVGSTLGGRYVLERTIGRGGYGSVFEARHLGTGQGVAIKVLAHGLEGDELALARFFQEARVTSGLRHPNTVRVFDFGQDDSGVVFLAMELLSGLSLKQALKERQREGRVFSEREVLDIAVQITKSLSEAHAAGLVHRDLKPDNIFLQRIEGDDVVVKVLDFGIVKRPDSSLTLGSDSGIPGTPAFMSPEQVKKRSVDARSDLYSLGVLMFDLVAGVVPFRGEDALQTLYMHVHEPLPDLRALAKTPVSAGFVRVVERCLAKEPRDRPREAQALRVLLEAVRAGRDLPDEDATTTTPSRAEAALLAGPLLGGDDRTLPPVPKARGRRETEDPSIPDVRPAPLERPRSLLSAGLLGALLAGLVGAGIILLYVTHGRPPAEPVVLPPARPAEVPPAPRPAPPPEPARDLEPAPTSTRALVPSPAAPESDGPAKRPRRPKKREEDVLDLKI